MGRRRVFALAAYDQDMHVGRCVLDPRELEIPEGYLSGVLINLTALFGRIRR